MISRSTTKAGVDGPCQHQSALSVLRIETFSASMQQDVGKPGPLNQAGVILGYVLGHGLLAAIKGEPATYEHLLCTGCSMVLFLCSTDNNLIIWILFSFCK